MKRVGAGCVNAKKNYEGELERVIICAVADRDYADLAAKVAALEERLKTLRAEHRADIERQANVFTWRVLIMLGIVGGLIIAAVRL